MPVVEPRPRLLFITIDMPRDGGSGGQIVSWRLLETYARFCDVDVLAITPSDAQIHPDLERIANRVALVRMSGFHFARARLRTVATFLAAQLGSLPYRIAKFRRSEVSRLVKAWDADQPYDVVHCDHLSSAQYRDLLPGARAILMEHNIEWQILRRLAEAHRRAAVRFVLRRDARGTRAWEAAALDRFDHVFALSHDDRQALLLLRADRSERVSVWPVPVRRAPSRPARTADGPLTVLVLGSLRSIGRAQGLRWFMQEVWPGVRRAVSDARLEVVGSDPPRDIAGRDGQDGVRVHGYVASLDQLLDRADLCAIPLFVGGGIRIKVLELVARGIPCFGTELALQGLGWVPGCVELGSAEAWTRALVAAADRRTSLEVQARLGAAELASRHGEQAAAGEVELVLAGLEEADARRGSAGLVFAEVA